MKNKIGEENIVVIQFVFRLINNYFEEDYEKVKKFIEKFILILEPNIIIFVC